METHDISTTVIETSTSTGTIILQLNHCGEKLNDSFALPRPSTTSVFAFTIRILYASLEGWKFLKFQVELLLIPKKFPPTILALSQCTGGPFIYWGCTIVWQGTRPHRVQKLKILTESSNAFDAGNHTSNRIYAFLVGTGMFFFPWVRASKRIFRKAFLERIFC